MFSTDKMKDLTPLDVVYVPGESPTAQKLQGMQEQDANAIKELEMAIGDMYNNSGHSYSWFNTLARMIGSSDDLNPVILPSYEENDYIQYLTAGKAEHELDFIPVGVGSDIIKESYDSSIDAMSYKSDVSLLVEEGDWTIAQAQEENGNKKNEKRLITHSPSTGGYVIFNKVTTGKGSIDENAKYSLIPTLAQAKTGGPYVTMSLSSATLNTYVLTLPEIKTDSDISGNPIDVTLSNTKTHVVTGRKYEFPHYFFSVDGLDLASDDTTSPKPEKVFPLNIFQIYNWDTKERLSGIIEVRASVINTARKYQVYVRFQKDIQVDVDARYIVAVSGNSITQYLKTLSRFMVEHKHAGNDMARHIAHKDLIGLRTGSTDTNNRSAFYGPSSIDANDHSMYFHRNGFTNTDKGGGANVIRGDVVIGSTSTGLPENHENYNLLSDSFGIVFGHHSFGSKLNFTKEATHSIPFGRKNISKDYVGPVFRIGGATNLTTQMLETLLVGNLRITGNTVLGTSSADAVIVPGDLYAKRSIVFLPSDTETTLTEVGAVRYSESQKCPVFYNGTVEVKLGANGCEILVGDGENSFGKYNGKTVKAIQSAIDEVFANNGGIVKIQKGEYDIGLSSIELKTNVSLKGEGQLTVIKGQSVLVNVTADSVKIENLKLMGTSDSLMATKGISVNGNSVQVETVTFEYIQKAIVLETTSQKCNIGTSNIYKTCIHQISYEGIPSFTNLVTLKKPVGHISDFRMNNWSDKAEILSRVSSTSGIELFYDLDSAQNSIGHGAFRITGIGQIIFDDYIPVSPYAGIGGYVDMWKVGTNGNVIVGAKCYDKDYNDLGFSPFITYVNGGDALGQVDLHTEMYHYFGSAILEETGAKLVTGTRFIRPMIIVNSNSSYIYFDGLEVYQMPRLPARTDLSLVGTMVYSTCETAPIGYIPANGITIGKTTGTYTGNDYYDLYSHLWNLPGLTVTAGNPYVISAAKGSTPLLDWEAGKTITIDESGVFIRAYKTGTTNVVGSKQIDAMQSHKHTAYNTIKYTGSGPLEEGHGPPDYTYGPSVTSEPVEHSGYGVPRTATETRPTNVAKYAYIRYSKKLFP